MIYGYVRVSKADQNIDRQIESLKKYNSEIEKIYIDKKSGKDLDRQEYQNLKKQLVFGDEVVIHELDRLGRKKDDIKSEILWFNEQNIRLRILDIPTTLNIPITGEKWLFEMVNNIIIEVYSSIAEKERERLIKRTKEGLEQAKAKGVRLGRPTLSEKKVSNIIEMHKRGLAISEISKITDTSRSTIRNKLREFNKLK